MTCLRKFGKYICDWVNLFFKYREWRILLGGKLTDRNILEQGVSKGDIIPPVISNISGLAANLDETNVIPFGKYFDPGNDICHDLCVNWTNSFKLLGLQMAIG